jgi:hypothetical protein
MMRFSAFEIVDVRTLVSDMRISPKQESKLLLKQLQLAEKTVEKRVHERESTYRRSIADLRKKLENVELELKNTLASFAFYVAVDGQYQYTRKSTQQAKMYRQKLVEGRHVMMTGNHIANIDRLRALPWLKEEKRETVLHTFSEPPKNQQQQDAVMNNDDYEL